jgi:hypothetical protein
VKAAAGSASEIRKVPYSEVYGAGFEDMARRVPDVSKLERFTGYRPRTPLDRIIATSSPSSARRDRALDAVPSLSTSLTNETPGDGAGEPKPAGSGGTQASAAAAVERAATSTGRWWASALALLVVAFCVVIAWIVAANSGSDRFGPSPARTVNGAAFQLTRGGGHTEGTSFIVEALQDGIASASAEIQPFSADRYPRVEWDLRTIDAPAELLFAWRTRDNPRRTYSKQLLWIGGAIVPLRLSADDGWRGTITDIALVARGSLPAPSKCERSSCPRRRSPRRSARCSRNGVRAFR